PPAATALSETAPSETTPAETTSAEPRRRRRWPLVVGAVVLLLAGAGAFFAVDQLQTPTFPVPDVLGDQIDDLQLIADQNEWVLDEKRTRRNGTVPGEIVSTEPVPGEQLEEGGTLVVVVSEGNELADVPADLAGRPLDEVVLQLESAGLTHTVTEEVFDEEVPAGHVVRVDGDDVARLPEGEAVGLVVSRGPEPRTVPEPADGAVYDAVAAQLSDIGLVPVRSDQFSDSVPAGVVISLSEDPGSQVPRGSEITVAVSKGPDVVGVPDLSGLTLAEAEGALEAQGLALGQDCCNSRGRVITSQPASGDQVRRGTEVDVFLSRG
ncbi:MAG: PASTA domain-containing protein, partial [Acidimicrobiales bacterium]